MKYNDTDIIVDEVLIQRIEEKKKRLDLLRPLSKDALKALLADIRLRHTYHSDAIEGNTLTLQETKLVLEEGVTIGGKPLKDHIEARNDADAFDLMVKLVSGKKQISQETIQQIHAVVTQGILDRPGQYRTGNVRIAGSTVTPPNYAKIIGLMDDYIHTIRTLHLHPVKQAAIIHYELVRIHPFFDGNGRVARLLSNLFLMQEGYPPIIVKKTDRKIYYRTLKTADHGDLSEFAQFIARAIHEGLQYYLSSFIEEERLIPLRELANNTSYSQEYLSLRARQGKFDAVKIEDVWYSSKRALKEYAESLNN
jgi:Fic family protein